MLWFVKRKVLYKSLIGREIQILDSTNKNQIGIKGVLVYESSNMFFLDNNIKLLKSSIIFKVKIQDKELKVDGRLLNSTLTQRIKKFR